MELAKSNKLKILPLCKRPEDHMQTHRKFLFTWELLQLANERNCFSNCCCHSWVQQSRKSEPTVVSSELWVAFFWQNAGRNYLNQTQTEQDLVLPTSAYGLEEEFGFLPSWFASGLHRNSVILQVTNFTISLLWFCGVFEYEQTHLGFKVGLEHSKSVKAVGIHN